MAKMTRENAMRCIFFYLSGKVAGLMQNDSPTSLIEEAIKQLQAGNTEPVFEILDKDQLHLQQVQCGDFDNHEASAAENAADRANAAAQNQEITEWRNALS